MNCFVSLKRKKKFNKITTQSYIDCGFFLVFEKKKIKAIFDLITNARATNIQNCIRIRMIIIYWADNKTEMK